MGLVLTLAATVFCPHGAPISFAGAQRSDLLIDGFPVLTPMDTAIISGCPNTSPDGSPQPCTLVQWIPPFGTYEEAAVLTTDTTGMCTDGAGVPAGPATIASPGQTDVTA